MRFSGKCNPHRGAKPVNAVANADRPDSRLVINEVQELEKHTAFDSAQDATPDSSSIPLSYGVQDKVASIPKRSYA